MVDIQRLPDAAWIYLQKREEAREASLRYELTEEGLEVYLRAEREEPAFVCLRWKYRTEEPVRVLGDKWERTYADMRWQGLSDKDFLPWYFLATNGRETVGCGVMVQPGSFVSFQYDARGVTAWFDVRCGAAGVRLAGRELPVATVLCRHYTEETPFAAARAFCRAMCPKPLLPAEPVYGSNNWYYAYGRSSGREIRQDAALLAELTEGLPNRPYMVIDDGWEPIPVSGPWRGNDRHGDMAAIAEDFKALGVKPGIWIRLTHDEEAEAAHPEWTIRAPGRDGSYLDPSHPEVQAYLTETLARVQGWGYTLLKHDYSTHDLFGHYGLELRGMITEDGDWSFYDRTKTSAEIVLDFYRLIRRATPGMMVLGCNTVSHLCAGLVEVNRVGDDTSGRNWDRTRAMGVNTLAFRMPQNDAFYKIDADCVGILGRNIPWPLNARWLELVAESGSPLFVSAQPSAMTAEIKDALRRAYRANSLQTDRAEPLDWLYNDSPARWNINGEIREFDWMEDSLPPLRHNAARP